MVRRSLVALLLVCGVAGLVLAADYKNATFVEGLPQSKDGKPVPNARFEYEATDRKTKKTEKKTVDVLLSVGFVRAPGWLDEKGKPIKIEKIIDYNKPGVVADIKTEKRKDGIEYVVGLKVVKAPPADEKKDK
jgi:hypothetical protein